MRRSCGFVVAGSLLLTLVAPAWGKDFCIDVGVLRIVAKQFTIPGKGKCKPLTGIFGSSGGTDAFVSDGDIVSGTVCTNDAKTALRIGFTVHPGSIGGGDLGGSTIIGQTNIALPGLVGGATALRVIGSNGATSGIDPTLTSAGPCPTAKVPIP